MATDAVTSASLLARAEARRTAGQGVEAAILYRDAADLAANDGDLHTQVEAVLGLARFQEYNLTPGSLPVRLHAAYSKTTEPRAHARLAGALARCWAYGGEPHRARPFADEALTIADGGNDPVLRAVWWRNRLQQSAQHMGAARASSPTTVQLQQQSGGLWLVGRAGHQVNLPNLRGLRHLQALVAHPNIAVDALSLVTDHRQAIVDESGLELLDDQARQAYRARLIELEHEIEDAVAGADLGRVELLTDEREALLEQLRTATRIGGRGRTTGSSRERARIAVRKAIVAAVAQIAETDPWLGRHLRDHIRTGAECRYESDPDHPVRWVLN